MYNSHVTKIVPEYEKKKKTPELNFNASLTLILKPDTAGTKKENSRLISLLNTDAKP